jgi:hypothetical protein
VGSNLHVKYGGMGFTRLAPPEEINRFVRELPAEERESLAVVVRRLEEAGLIALDGEHTMTVDDEMQGLQEPNK